MGGYRWVGKHQEGTSGGIFYLTLLLFSLIRVKITFLFLQLAISIAFMIMSPKENYLIFVCLVFRPTYNLCG